MSKKYPAVALLAGYVVFLAPATTEANHTAFEAVKWAGITAGAGAVALLVVLFLLAGNQARLAQSCVQDSVVVLADLDRFKSVNDRFGHATGDRVLRAYAQACSGVLRAGDLICRFGGEEFVLLLPDSTPADAERLTRLITTRFQMLASLPDFTATASYGLASTEDGADLQLLIERVIVGEDTLEIRHVIPLSKLPPGTSGPDAPDARLRSDSVRVTQGAALGQEPAIRRPAVRPDLPCAEPGSGCAG